MSILVTRFAISRKLIASASSNISAAAYMCFEFVAVLVLKQNKEHRISFRIVSGVIASNYRADGSDDHMVCIPQGHVHRKLHECVNCADMRKHGCRLKGRAPSTACCHQPVGGSHNGPALVSCKSELRHRAEFADTVQSKADDCCQEGAQSTGGCRADC